jgi:Mor family transcriptional regulator
MEPDDLLGAVHDAVYALLVRRGVEELTAIADTQALCRALQRDLGGRGHYLPALGKELRHRQIAADLRAGVPPAAIAKKHDVHPKTVAKIAARAQQAPNEDPGLGTSDWVLK